MTKIIAGSKKEEQDAAFDKQMTAPMTSKAINQKAIDDRYTRVIQLSTKSLIQPDDG